MVSLKSFKLINETESDTTDVTHHHTQQLSVCLKATYDQESLLDHRRQSSLDETFTGENYDFGIQKQQKHEQIPMPRVDNIIDCPSKIESNNNTSLRDQNGAIKPEAANGNIKQMETKMNDQTAEEGQSRFTVVGSQNEINCKFREFDGNSKNGKAVVAVTLAPNMGGLAKGRNIIKSDTNDATPVASPISSSISIVVVKHNDNIEYPVARHNLAKSDKNCLDNIERNTCFHEDKNDDNISQNYSASLESSVNMATNESSNKDRSITLPPVDYCNETTHATYQDNLIVYSSDLSKAKQQYPTSLEPPPTDLCESRLSVNTESDHFEIVWSNLSYRIEPKWHKKINYVDRVLTYFMPGQTIDSHSSATSTASSSAGMNDNQHQMHVSAGADSHLAPMAKQKSPTDPIEIFSNLNGTIKSGQMTAVLGPSGAGKTTLLNCLTGNLRKGVSGHINLKGANGKHLKMCTIPQKDHLLEQLTVEENLWFASKIKNPEYGFDHVKNIERVIDLLGLKRCRSAKIKKISGGQYKRVSIAQELLSNPDILVLDEPTSGLDSLTCFKTISMLRDLVELSANNDFMKPMAIIVTIHQPQPKVFNLFHHVYILANGGRVIYEGPPDRSVETITAVTDLRPMDLSKSTSLASGAIDPASFLIEIASEEYGVGIINTLSDYQRNIFYQTHCNKGNSSHDRQHSTTENVGSKGARTNHAFSPDFDHTKMSDKIPAELVVSNVTSQQATDMTKESNPIMRQRPVNEVKKSSPKIKRKKRSEVPNQEDEITNSMNESSQNGSQTSFHNPNLYLSEQLLYTRVANHKGRFWSHTATLTHRTLLTIRRDPLLMTSRVLFHLMIPILMGHVYGKATGAANACPHYEPEIDITQIPSLVENKRIEFMLEELHMSIENVSMFFIIMYAFAAAVLALNALSFPLNMQVLLKETRNGWYSMSSYVLAKTLADLPLELTMPCMTMLLVYPLTGQPSSYLQWRMLTICLIMTLCSLIAQTQALILGALVMNSVQTAVFVSQASQLPWVILAGFTIRIKRLSEPLKLISLTSFYRLGCEAITLTRYGFGICPCDPNEITGEPVRLVGIPDQLRTVAQYWIDSVEASKSAASNDTADLGSEESTSLSTMVTTTLAPPTASTNKIDIFQHLANQLSYANSYGVNITSCNDVAPDRIRAINLSDNWLVARIWHLIIMLVIMKILLYYAVRFSIGIRL